VFSTRISCMCERSEPKGSKKELPYILAMYMHMYLSRVHIIMYTYRRLEDILTVVVGRRTFCVVLYEDTIMHVRAQRAKRKQEGTTIHTSYVHHAYVPIQSMYTYCRLEDILSVDVGRRTLCVFYEDIMHVRLTHIVARSAHPRKGNKKELHTY
jgi:hypothetical protein